jgi:hypothetical protein
LNSRDFLNTFTTLQNTNNRTAFRIVREAEIASAVLSSNLTRESIVYSAEFLKGDAYVQTKKRKRVFTNDWWYFDRSLTFL